MNQLPIYVLSALATLIILTVHEFSHGYVAYRLGDDTAKNQGRLTLNPLAHLDPIGALCMIFFHFGWAKPVPINPRNFKDPKRDFAITALAGPLSNIVMAFFSAFLYLLYFALIGNVAIRTELQYNILYYTGIFLYLFHICNLGLGLFNLIPVPPLDGSRILNVVLPPKQYFAVMKHERTIYWVLIGWLFIGKYVSEFLLRFSIVSESAVLTVFAKILSLSGLLSSAIDGLSRLMMNFWKLIPFLNI